MFEDRKDAGERLADALSSYQEREVVVLAIPRGGTEVGYEVARRLKADLSVAVARKLPFPGNPEAGFGAIAEDGSTFILPEASFWFPPSLIKRIVDQQTEEVRRRIEVLRQGRPLPDLTGRTVILVDDGIAAGSTMRVTISLARNRGAASVVVAATVAADSEFREMWTLADDVVVLETPPDFRAVAQVYRHWRDVSDDEVVRILDRWRQEKMRAA
ncbi:MAG: phosphoribosyltransferase [Anaerolineae bacterium]